MRRAFQTQSTSRSLGCIQTARLWARCSQKKDTHSFSESEELEVSSSFPGERTARAAAKADEQTLAPLTEEEKKGGIQMHACAQDLPARGAMGVRSAGYSRRSS